MKKQEKKLQTVTDLTPEKEVPEKMRTMSVAEANAFMDTYLNDPNTPEAYKQDLRNQTWEANHSLIIGAINDLINQYGSMPTVNVIVQRTGLTRQSVHRHLKEFIQSEQHGSQLNQFRIMRERVLATLYRLADRGDVRACKVYLDATGESMLPTSAPNYIQINNSIKIDQVTFAALPDEVQQQITGLILQGLQTKLNPGTEPSETDQIRP